MNASQENLIVAPSASGKCIFSVDVEDWFHILQVDGAPRMDSWATLPSHVETNFLQLLDMFDEARVQVTCFFLGWIAERYPNLVREAVERGHEIASHGYAHRLVFEMTESEFRQDATRARKLLEDISGNSVLGYRSAGFSATHETDWFFRALLESGYDYDSSVFPARRGHGGMENANRAPHMVHTEWGSICEFPISVVPTAGRSICFFGGGYLRFFPYWVIRRMSNRVLNEGLPVLFYIHPREIDPNHPRVPMPPHRRFKSYVNLDTTRPKLEELLSDFSFITFRDFLNRCDIAPKSRVTSA